MNARRRYFGEQFEFQDLKMGTTWKSSLPSNEVIDELRARLRRAQAAQLRAEANLAIVAEERNKLAARLRRVMEALKA
jgi:hypothetical protein